MNMTVTSPSVTPQRENTESKPVAKTTEPRRWLKEVGQCLFRARMSLGWTLDQMAKEIGRDPRQVQRWEAGNERTQVDTVFSCQELREPFGRELATLSGAQVLLVFRKAG